MGRFNVVISSRVAATWDGFQTFALTFHNGVNFNRCFWFLDLTCSKRAIFLTILDERRAEAYSFIDLTPLIHYEQVVEKIIYTQYAYPFCVYLETFSQGFFSFSFVVRCASTVTFTFYSCLTRSLGDWYYLVSFPSTYFSSCETFSMFYVATSVCYYSFLFRNCFELSISVTHTCYLVLALDSREEMNLLIHDK